ALFCSQPAVVSRRVAFFIKRGPLSRWKYSRPARLLAVSEYVRGTLVEAGGGPYPIAIVYDGGAFLPVSENHKTIVTPTFADPRKATALASEAATLSGVDLRFSHDLDSDLSEASLFLYLTEMEGLGSAALLAMSAGVPVIASAVGGLTEVV